ncbi:MAG TPA: AAA family ATPase [Bryobacteraceae bacterium]|nr:AAA family ATPase [Bryobacteraceae bacterium]
MLIRSLRLRNILSFREPEPLTLEPLNILIGPNGAGKSNLIDCIGLLQALPTNVSTYLNRGGGPEAWIWKGQTAREDLAWIGGDFQIDSDEVAYDLVFGVARNGLRIESEDLSLVQNPASRYLARRQADLTIDGDGGRAMRSSIGPGESGLFAYRNPRDSTPITGLSRELAQIRIYRGFNTGANDSIRTGIASSASKHPLEEDGSNLALTLQELDFHNALARVTEKLNRLSSRFQSVKIRAEGGFSQVYAEEEQLGKIPAARLSDGTLRFLCLMDILLDPNPAPLVCIDEPEAGLHPDAVAVVADVIREASSRMQLIVSTHSDALVDRFSDRPECVLVCDRGFDESTRIRRLSRDQLREWLDEYTLGDLWRRGEIGGTQR